MFSYKIITHTSPEHLSEQINEMAKKGWRPHGGLSVCVRDDTRLFYQAMINDKTEEATKTKK